MLLVGNGTLITRSPDAPFLPNGAVAIDGRTIAAVGAWDELRAAYPQAEVIDAKGGVTYFLFLLHLYRLLDAPARHLVK